MKWIVFSDIHSNYYALSELAKYLSKYQLEEVRLYFLGDLFGYLKYDARVALLLRDLQKRYNMHMLLGNHDAALCNAVFNTNFSVIQSDAIRDTLNDNICYHKDFMEILQQMNTNIISAKIGFRQCHMFHGGLRDNLNEYYYPDLRFLQNAKPWIKRHHTYMFGHTHRPFIIEWEQATLINVGSLGLPRDHDNKLSFVEIERDDIRVIRLNYDFDAVYTYNRELPNAIKNRIYFGSKSAYLNYDLIGFNDVEKKLIGELEPRICPEYYARGAYLKVMGRSYQLFKIARFGITYLLRTEALEHCFNKLEILIDWVKKYDG